MRRERRAENLRRLRQAAPKIDITIGELVLRGFPACDRHAIGDAFVLELESVFSTPGLEAHFRHHADLPSLCGGSFATRSPGRPASVGAQAAGSVFAALTAGRRA